METKFIFQTNIYLQFIQIAPWLGYLTRPVMSFPWTPSWLECWQTAVVCTAASLGTHPQVIGVLVPMLRVTRRLTMPTVVAMLSMYLTFSSPCNPGVEVCMLQILNNWSGKILSTNIHWILCIKTHVCKQILQNSSRSIAYSIAVVMIWLIYTLMHVYRVFSVNIFHLCVCVCYQVNIVSIYFFFVSGPQWHTDTNVWI